MSKESITMHGSRREDIFLAGVEFLSKKYQIENYTLITKNCYHLTADSEVELEVKKELAKLFQK